MNASKDGPKADVNHPPIRHDRVVVGAKAHPVEIANLPKVVESENMIDNL